VCGNLKALKTCEQVEYENKKLQRVHLMMKMQNQDNDMNLQQILGDFKKTTKTLECNDECKTLERNRRLDIAFKVINPTLATTPRFVPTYSDFTRNYYKKDSSFVNMVHEKLTDLVKLAKESKTAFRSYSFPSMNRDKRHVIHDMGELFGVETKGNLFYFSQISCLEIIKYFN
jgi:transcriptional repressor NF-X1